MAVAAELREVPGARNSAGVVVAAIFVGSLLLDWWLGRGLAEQAQHDFAQWAAARGLQPDPEPVPEHTIGDAIRRQRSRPMLLPHPSRVGRAATRTGDGARITYLDWSESSGDGHAGLHSGLLIHTAPTGSQLQLEPTGRGRRSLPGTSAHRPSGHALLDDVYVISGPTTSPYTGAEYADPSWIDAAVAEALVPFAARRARIEIADDLVVVACPRVPDADRDSLLEDGLRLAAALAARDRRS